MIVGLSRLDLWSLNGADWKGYCCNGEYNKVESAKRLLLGGYQASASLSVSLIILSRVIVTSILRKEVTVTVIFSRVDH